MAQRNFTQFSLRTNPLTGDYIVGYKVNGSEELRTSIQNIIDTVYNSNPTNSNGFSLVKQSSAIWNLSEELYANVFSNSATNWNYQGTDLKELSGNWQNTYFTVLNNANTIWAYQGTDLKELSGKWNESSTYIQENSAYFEQSLEASTITTNIVAVNSENWNFGYDVATYVQDNSGNWEESAEIIPTVTNYLSTNNVLINSLNITDKLTSSTYITTSSVITNITETSYLISDTVNGKIITFDNTNPITVSIPSGLPVGFNITLIQIGAGQVSLSAGPNVTINSDGSKLKIATQHSSVSLISYATNVFNLAGNLAP